MPLFWEALKAEDRAKLKLIMERLGCVNWNPLLPPEEESVVIVEARRDEIKKIMKEKPRG